jgi:UDP-N-acetylmuramate dehydrogenase
MNSNIKDFLRDKNIDFEEGVMISKLTKIKGTAFTDVLVKPKSMDIFEAIVRFAIQNDLKFDVVGHWSNTYFADNYRSDLVVLTGGLKKTEFFEERIVCETGVRLASLARELSKKGITGYEGLTGVPGTVGAAAINNAGSCGSCMQDLVESVIVLKNSLVVAEYDNKTLSYNERNSALKSGALDGYVLKVTLKTDKRDSVEEIEKRIKDNNAYRLGYVDGKRKSVGTVFVASSVRCIQKRYAFRLFLRRALFAVCSIIVRNKDKRKRLRVYLFFLVLGHPEIAKHCDSFNRFCWDKSTTEKDFYKYISIMKRLTRGAAKLEVQIKE